MTLVVSVSAAHKCANVDLRFTTITVIVSYSRSVFIAVDVHVLSVMNICHITADTG